MTITLLLAIVPFSGNTNSFLHPANAASKCDSVNIQPIKKLAKLVTGITDFVATIHTSTNDYAIGIDYAHDLEQPRFFINRHAVNPDNVQLAAGETITIDLGDRSLEQVGEILGVSLLRNTVSDCDLLLGNVNANEIIHFDKVSENQFLVPGGSSIVPADFTKIVVGVLENGAELEEVYIVPEGVEVTSSG